MKILVALLGASLLLLFAVASAPARAQDDGIVLYPLPPTEEHQRLIDRLKETTVSQIEPGLPDETFDSWCSRLVKPKRVEYEVRESQERVANVAFQRALWVVAYTQLSLPEGTRWIEVRFIVVDTPRSKTTSNRGEPKPFALKFFEALESETVPRPTFPLPGNPIPARPLMNQPYDRFLKLSALEEDVQRARGKGTRRKVPL